MTGSQAAALVWAVGTALFAWVFQRMIARHAQLDPFAVCSRCRDRRRKAQLLIGFPDAVIAFLLIFAAALWPVMGPVTLVGRTWVAVRRGYWRHDCALQRLEERLTALRNSGGDA